MKLRTVVASAVIGLTTLGCSPKSNLFQKPDNQVEPTKENILSVPVQKKRSFGKWRMGDYLSERTNFCVQS